jgi:Tol biopolymer transport system component
MPGTAVKFHVLTSAAALAIGVAGPVWANGITERVNLGPAAVQADDASYLPPAISADGRFVAFDSDADNLVPGDTNRHSDVFIRDRQTGITERLSVGRRGVQGNSYSENAAISANGRFVAFYSAATNLVPGDTNGFVDVFVRDRKTGATQRVSLGRASVQGDFGSYDVAISADGRFVAFTSDATNLVPGDTNRVPDVFVRDRATGTTQRVSVGPGGVQGDFASFSPTISANGRFVAFFSAATKLVPGDTNGVDDVFIRDCKTGVTQRVSLGRGRVQGDFGSYIPAISADGRFVAFSSDATNLVPGDTNGVLDAFVRDRQGGTTRRVSLGSAGIQRKSGGAVSSISADGRFVVFVSVATKLVPGDTNSVDDVFIRDRQMGVTRRVSVGQGGVQANGSSDRAAISADGRFVAFLSRATNLVPGDTNSADDVFVRILAP